MAAIRCIAGVPLLQVHFRRRLRAWLFTVGDALSSRCALFISKSTNRGCAFARLLTGHGRSC